MASSKRQAGADDATLDQEEATTKLAERLYWNMQRLDPDLAAPEWPGLTERQRRYYRLLVQDLVCFDELIRPAQRR
jgi:hypothetical protein